MLDQYGIDTWAARTKLGRQIFNASYRLVSAAPWVNARLADWQRLKELPMAANGGRYDTVTIWQLGTEEILVRVTTGERDSWDVAQLRLADDLAQSMRPSIPPGTGVLDELGDVNFVSRDPGTDFAASISFSRGNLFVSVRSVGGRTVDVGRFALWIDRELTQRLDQIEVKVRGTEILELHGEIPTRDGGWIMIPSISEFVPPGVWMKVLADGDAELRQIDDSLVAVGVDREAARATAYLTPVGPRSAS